MHGHVIELPRFTNFLGMEFVKIPAGIFTMGSNDISYASPAHEEIIPEDYWICTTILTQAQYNAVMGKNPSKVQGDNLPVTNINWYDAMEFCELMSQLDPEREYSLPTEEQWEYAAKAGTNWNYVWGEENDESESRKYLDPDTNSIYPVGQYLPNRWGLYDVAGNVWELTSSEFIGYDEKLRRRDKKKFDEERAAVEELIRSRGQSGKIAYESLVQV